MHAPFFALPFILTFFFFNFARDIVLKSDTGMHV